MADTNITDLQGRVERLTFHNPENGYTVAQVVGPDGQFTAVGKMPGVVEGSDVVLRGKMVIHPKFGPQVEVESFEQRPPSGKAGIRRYLASGLVKGVGPKLAETLVDFLGEEALDIIMQEPEQLKKIPGIGKKRAASIAEAVRSHGVLREVMVFLQGHGVPGSTALRIFKRYGSATLDIMQREPHRLASDMRGIGFATADKIAGQLGIADDDPTRISAGLLHTLQKGADSGHVYLPYDELIAQASQLLSLERDFMGPPFTSLHTQGRIKVEEEAPGRPVYPMPLYVLEKRAAAALGGLAASPGVLPLKRAAKAVSWVGGELQVRPSPAQQEALRKLLTSGLTVLTGGPGTGKTTLIRALITIAQKMKLEVALAAPTGRAAKRLQETSGHSAKTLHRMLEYSPKENRFLRGAEKPLTADLVVVDESSMLDIWLCAHLAEAVAGGSKLVLVGDADQLPSVGPGLVLRQLIDSKVVPVAALTEIFRQNSAGLIVHNAHRVLHGRMPELPPPGQAQDFFFIDEPDSIKAARRVLEVVTEHLPQKYGLDPISDIQVLAPMHRGNLGCENLNRLLRGALNPRGSAGLAPGDKVMQVRNNYDLDVFNGDVGQVFDAGPEGCTVQFGDRQVVYSLPESDDLVLAYAITIHKSQGSEYPAVVIALAGEHFIMLNRPLIYTAMTRGKGLVVLVGQRQAVKKAVFNSEPIRRYAMLDERLKQVITM